MPKFHFPIVDGVKLEDPVGLDLKSDDQARQHAEQIALHLALADVKNRNVVVVDESGNEIHKVPVK